MSASVETKAKKIQGLILDVDGVLTSGRIHLDHQGHEIKSFDVKDGMGIVLWHKAGFKTAIISSRAAPAVTVRAQDLGIEKIYQNAYPKTNAFEQILTDWQVTADEVCFMGDDLPDLAVLRRAGLAVSVPNAIGQAQDMADYVTTARGGYGAVREVIELILKAQGRWLPLLKEQGIEEAA